MLFEIGYDCVFGEYYGLCIMCVGGFEFEVNGFVIVDECDCVYLFSLLSWLVVVVWFYWVSSVMILKWCECGNRLKLWRWMMFYLSVWKVLRLWVSVIGL